METPNQPKEGSSSRQLYQTIAICVTALAAWLIYYYTRPLANVVNAIDNSTSNVPFAKQSIRSCEQIKEKVIDGDLFTSVGFADESVITSNAPYDENHTALDCNKVTTKPLSYKRLRATTKRNMV